MYTIILIYYYQVEVGGERGLILTSSISLKITDCRQSLDADSLIQELGTAGQAENMTTMTKTFSNT